MSSPLEQYFSRLRESEGPPKSELRKALEERYGQRGEGGFLDFVKRLNENPQETLKPIVDAALARSRSFVGDANQIAQLMATPAGITNLIAAAMGDEEAAAEFTRFGPLAAGVAESAVADPIEGVLGLPGALYGKPLITDKWADWINRASLGARTAAENMALEAGVDEETISNAYALGNFVGFTAPIAASMKMATLALRTGQTIRGAVTSGEYLTDFTAGLIFGGLLQPGTAKERVKNMAAESAAFGIMRTLLMVGTPLRAMRHNRARELDVSGRLSKMLDDMENGRITHVEQMDDLVGPQGVLQLMQEENFIVHSAAAQDLLMRNEYDNALVQSIIDVAGARGSGGVVRNMGTVWEEVAERAERIRAQFPALKVEAVRGPSNQFDIFFGTKGLTNLQRKQFKAEGRFDRQVMHYGSDEVLYRGKAKREGWIKVETLDGTLKQVRESNVSELPIVREAIDATPEFDTLYQGFRKFVEDNQTKVIRARGGLTEFDLVQGVRSGTIRLDPEARRGFETSALIYPEELGITGEHTVQAISFVGENPGMVTRNTRRGTVDQWYTNDPSGIEGPWRFTAINPETGEPLGHSAFNSLQEAVEYGESIGSQIEDVVSKYPGADEMARLVSETGLEHTRLLEPQPALSFEEIFDHWADDVGLPRDATDFYSARSYFAERFRREMWDSVPEADRAIFKSLTDEYERLMVDAEDRISTAQLAAVKGFHAELLEGGAVGLRQIDSGLAFRFGSDRMARQALQKIVRAEKDLPGLIQTGGHGIVDWTRGLPRSQSITFEEVITELEDLKDIPFRHIRNNRDWLLAVEDATGLPVWSKGFDPIQQGYTQMLADYEPYSKEIQNIWSGINIQRRQAVADIWVQAEKGEMKLPAVVKLMKDEGFSAKEINALRRSRIVFDDLFAISGISRSRYIDMYYTRVRPFVDKHGVVDLRRIFGEDLLPAEQRFWAEYTRTGDLAVMEMDPELVMHKYARTLFFQQHVKQHWDELARLTGTTDSPPMKFKDLPDGLRQQALKNALPGTSGESPVLPAEVRKVLSEYLMVIRGQTAHTTQMTRAFAKKMFQSLNIDADERIVEEMINSWISMQYGAAMGLRPSTVARNMTQTLWMLYPRVGSKTIGRGLELSMTREGFDEAIRAGVIPLQEAGIPVGDAIFDNIVQRSPQALNKGNPLAIGLAGAIRSSSRLGRAGRDLSRRTLTWYSSSDHASRAWSYFAQKLHTDEWLRRYERGDISWEKFADEGLGFFPQPAKDKFADIYNRLNREEALQFVGRLGSDEANFIYGLGAQPAWMQSMPGRLVGMFGTWPLWAIEAYMRPIRYAKPAQFAKFYLRTAALSAAFVNMGMQAGIDIWSWIAPGSIFGWSGGPAVEHAINAKRVIEAPWDQKRSAFQRLAKDMSRLAIPGQIFATEAMRASQLATHNPELAVLSMLLGRPSDTDHIGLNYLYNPDRPLAEPIMSPETFEAYQDIDRPTWIDTLDFEEGPPPATQTEQVHSLDNLLQLNEGD